MLEIQQEVCLRPYTTFGIAAKAKHYVRVTNTEQLVNALGLKQYPNKFLLGGGSNMLLTKDIDALVIHIAIKGIEIVQQSPSQIIVKAYAGENWHDFVLWAIAHNYAGIENLSLIPGNVGTAPIQNIGAYGVELKDVFQSCNAINIKTLERKTFSLEACNFGYRDSIFKQKEKGKYVITSVNFTLQKTNHTLKTAYGSIATHLKDMGINTPTIQDVSNAVIAIRQSKLPDPKVLGNSGSFFKNPIVKKQEHTNLFKKYPEMPFYTIDNEHVKIPAGWLIEKAGFKAKRFGDAGVHQKQALVLVNHGNATGNQIKELAFSIQKNIKNIFGITIEPEVNIF